MQRVRHSSPLYNKQITQYYNDNPDIPIEVQNSNANYNEFVKEHNKYVSQYAELRKQQLEEERLRKKQEYDELYARVQAKERASNIVLPSGLSLSTADKTLEEDKKRLLELAKDASMTEEEAYLDVVLNSNKEDMPQSVLEAALSQKEKERKWYQKSFEQLKDSDNPAEWILGNLVGGLYNNVISPFFTKTVVSNPANIGLASAVWGTTFAIEQAIKGLQNKSYEADVAKEQQLIRELFYSYSEKARDKAFAERLNKLKLDSLLNTIRPDTKTQDTVASREELIYHELTKPDTVEKMQYERMYQRYYDNYVSPQGQWAKDAYYKFMENMNVAQRDNFTGRIIRTKELLDLVDTYEQYLNNQDELTALLNRLEHLEEQRDYLQHSNQNVSGFGKEITDIRNRITELTNDNARKQEAVNKLQSFVPDNFVDKVDTYVGATFGEWINKQYRKAFPQDWSGPLVNDADYIRYFLLGIGDAEKSRGAIERFRRAANSKIAEWTQGINANEEDIKKLKEKYQVSDYFNWMEQHVKGGIFNWDTWLYQAPGFQGSSQSSWMKQAPSTLINLATMFYSGGTSVLPRIGAAAQSMALGHSSGADENYAEIAENYQQRLRTLLTNNKLYDEFINEGVAALQKRNIAVNPENPLESVVLAMLKGAWNPSGKNAHKMRQIAVNAAAGSSSLFELDMRATTLDDFVNTTLMLTPFTAASKEVKMLDKIVDVTGSISVPAQLAARGVVGAERFAAKHSKTIAGISKHFDDLGVFVESVPTKILNKVSPRPIKKFGSVMKNAYAGNYFSEANQIVYRAIRHNTGEALKRSASMAFAESIEEGKQYKHGQEYINGELAGDERRHWLTIDTFVKDAADGFKSAAVALGVPFGLEFTSDAEWALNIKGGIMGSLLQGGGSNVLNSVKPTISQAKMNRFAYKTALLEKAEAIDEYQKGILYAKRATESPEVAAELMRSFDNIVKINEERKAAGRNYIDSELFQEQKKVAQAVAQFANSKLVKDAAKRHEILPDTDEYNKLVSLVAMYARKVNESNETFQLVSNRLATELENIKSPYRIDETLNAVINDMALDDIENVVQSTVDALEGETKEDTIKRVSDNWNQNTSYFAQIAALTRMIRSMKEANATGEYFGKSANSNNFVIRRLELILEQRLDGLWDEKLDKQANKAKRETALRNAEYYTSLSENKEALIDLYRQQLWAIVDLDYNSAMLNMLVGNETKETENINKYFKFHSAKDVIEAIDKTLDKDEQLYSEIEKDYLNNFTGQVEEYTEESRKKYNIDLSPDPEQIPPLDTTTAPNGLKSPINKEGVTSNSHTNKDGTEIIKYTEHSKSKRGNIRREKKGGLEIDLDSVEGFEGYKSIKLAELRIKDGKFTGTIYAVDKDGKSTKHSVTFVKDPRIRKEVPLKKTYVAPQIKTSNKNTTEAQQRTIDDLNQRWADEQKQVYWGDDGSVVRSGHDYFIAENGQITMAKRVHAALPSQYQPDEKTKKEIRQLKFDLRKLWDNKDKRGFYEKVKALVDAYNGRNEQKIDLKPYWDQLKNNPKKVGDVIDAIVEMTTDTTPGVSVKVGNIFHQMAAKFFNGTNEVLQYTDYKDIMSEDVYTSIVEQLTKLKERYDALGWYIDARPHVFHKTLIDTKTGKKITVAGETDAIAVDRNGKLHIIDFKTSHSSFLPKQVITTSGPTTIDRFNTISTSEYNGKKAVMSTRDTYSQQLTMYDTLMGSVESIEIVPMVIRYDSHDNEVTLIYGLNIENNGSITLEFSNNVRSRFATVEDVLKLSVVWEANKSKIDKTISLTKTLADRSDSLTSEDAKALVQELELLKAQKVDSLATGESLFDRFYDLVLRYYIIANNARQKETYEDIDATNRENERRKWLEEAARMAPTWDDILESDISDQERAMNDLVARFLNAYVQLYNLAVEVYRGKHKVDPKGEINPQNTDPAILTKMSEFVSIIRQSLKDLSVDEETLPANLSAILSSVKSTDIVGATRVVTWATNVFGITGEEFKTPPIVPVVYSDKPWSQYTTTIKASIESAKAVDGSGKMLKDVTARPDFITNAKFLYVRIPTSKRICILITYDGVTYEPVEIKGADGKEGKRWFTDVVNAMKRANGKPVRPSKVARTFGRYKKGKQQSLLEKNLISVQDLYDLSYGNSLTKIGVVKDYAGQTVVTVPSDEGGIKPLYVFSNSEDHSDIKGTIQLMYTPVLNEVDNPILRQSIPVTLKNPNLTEGDADLIIDILTGKYNLKGLYGRASLDQEFLEEGVLKGLTCRQVLNMLLPVEMFGQKGKSIFHLDFSDKYPYLVYAVGRVAGDELKTTQEGQPIIPQRIWDLRNPDSTVDIDGVPMTFKQFLTLKVNKNISEEILRSRLGDESTYTQLDSPIKNIKSAVEKAGGSLRFGNSSLIFEKSDFVNPDTGDKRGLSGLGWYIKNQFLTTDFDGVDNTLLNFNSSHAIIDDDTNTPNNQSQEPKQVVPETPVVSSVTDSTKPTVPKYGRRASLDKIQPELGKSRPNHLEEARANIAKILKVSDGKTESGVDIVELVASQVKGGAWVVGKCFADCIKLSEFAEPGVEYHEAFHRIAEILMTKDERDRVYKLYKKHDKNSKNVREDIADEFMKYMLSDKPVVESKLFYRLKWVKLIKQIIEFVKFMNSFGGYRLYKVYSQIERGKYADVVANEERVKEFQKKYANGLNFTVRNIDLKTILNSHMYKSACRSVASMLLDANNIDLLMSNVKDISTDKELLIESESYKYYSKGDTLGAKVLKEFVNNWDTVLPDIVAELTGRLLPVRRKEDTELQTQQEDDLQQKLKELAETWGATFNNEPVTEPLDGESNEDGAEAHSASIAEHIHASYEFSQFSRTTPKVKFFFTRMNQTVYDEDGNEVECLNELGLPEYVDGMRVFNMVLNACHDVKDYVDLLDALDDLKQLSPIYTILYNRISKLVKLAYGDKDNINYDAEQLLTLIINSINAAKLNFELIQVNEDRNGAVSYQRQKVDEVYNSREFRKEWSQLFIHGKGPLVTTDADGNVMLKPGVSPYQLLGRSQMLTSMSTSPVFGKHARLGLAYAFSELGMSAYAQYIAKLNAGEQITLLDLGKLFWIKIDGKTTIVDVTNAYHLNQCKRVFCQILQDFGIAFGVEELNYMLREKYGSSGYLAMQSMFQDVSSTDKTGNVSTFSKLINGMLYYDKQTGVLSFNGGKNVISSIPAGNIFVRGDNTGFVAELARYKYLYQHSQDMLSELVVNGNKYYAISEHNLLTERTDDLNLAAAGQSVESIDIIKSFNYNIIYSEHGEPIGSLVLKEVDKAAKDSNSKFHLEFVPFSGMKTSRAGDNGQDYFQIVQRDDHLGKMYILQNNGIMSPTMSDKKSTGYLKGITLPGVQWNRNMDGLVVPYYSRGMVVANDDVLKQLWEYIMCERTAISDCLGDIYGRVDDLGNQIAPIPNSERVVNYHSGKTIRDDSGEHTIIQGARFSTLLGVYENDEYHSFNVVLETVTGKDGKPHVRYVDEQTNLNTADRLFFNPRKINDKQYESSEDMLKRQYNMINQLLHKRLIKELLYLETLGIISIGDKSSDKAILGSISNKYLDNVIIQGAYDKLLKLYGLSEKSLYEIDPETNLPVEIKGISKEQQNSYRSLAIASYVMDNMCKAIIAKQEFERLFSGHPAFTKYEYENGKLVDRGTDAHKRYGGLVSTGVSGNKMLLNTRDHYIGALVSNEMIESPLIDSIETLMKRGQLVQTYADYLMSLKYEKQMSVVDEFTDKEALQEVLKIAKSKTNEEIEAELSEKAPTALAIAVEIYTQKINAFKRDKDNKGIDVADGAAYISDEMCEILLRRAGSYNNKVAEAFRILRDPSKTKDVYELGQAYRTVFTTVIGTQKYTAYGYRAGNNLAIPYYDKLAFFPLFKSICTGRMAAIFEKMQQLGIDVLFTDSAVKLGGQGSVKIDWDTLNSGKEGDTRPTFKDSVWFNTYTQRFDELRKQFNTDPNEDKEGLTMGTQMTKIIMSVLRPGMVISTQDGRVLSASELLTDYMSHINEISKAGAKQLDEMFFTDGKLDLSKMSHIIQEELSRRGASKDLIESFSLVNGKMKISPAAQSNMHWIESIIASVVNKRIIDTHTAGNLFVLRSVWGMEGPTILGDENLSAYPKPINNGNRLKFINEEGSMDCVVSIDYFLPLLRQVKVKKTITKTRKVPNRYKDKYGFWKEDYSKMINLKYEEEIDEETSLSNCSFERQKQWLIDHDIISGVKTGSNEWHNASADIVGYRIPTLAISSIHALRVVDVLPVVRDTIILPAEFTKITGSDFDIDKLFLSGIQYVVNEDGSVSLSLNKDDKYYHQNMLIRDQVALLLNKDDETDMPYNVQQLHGPIDNDTDLVTSVINEITGNRTRKERKPYDDYVLSTETAIKNDLVTGKFGIGPYALHNNNHVLTTLYGIEFVGKKDSILVRNGLTSLHNYVDRDGKSILSWLSGLINLHVDIAKDPIIVKGNVNPFTYDLVALMIRIGLGKTTFYFTTQPIMKELSVRIANAKGLVGNDQSISQYQISKRAEEEYIKDLIEELTGKEYRTFTEAFDELTKRYFKSKNIDVNYVIDTLLAKDNDILKQSAILDEDVISNKEWVFDSKNGHFVLDNLLLLLITYIAYTQFKPYAQALSDLVKYSKIDTKKQGNTFIDQEAYRKGYYDVFYNANGTNKYFNDLSMLNHHSYIETKTNLALSAYEDIVKNLIFEATPLAKEISTLVLSITGNDNSRNIKLLKVIYDSIVQQVKSKYFNEYAERNGIDIKGLVSGNNTICDRLEALKIKISTDPQYADLLDQHGHITNILLRSLVTSVIYDNDPQLLTDYYKENHGVEETYPNAKFVRLLNFADNENLDSDALNSAWLELLNDQRAEIKTFARDLIVYAFITTGDVGGIKNLLRFVPSNWKLDSSTGKSYNEYMEKLMESFNNPKEDMRQLIDLEDIILNNWRDDQIVPTLRPIVNNERLWTALTIRDSENGIPYHDAPLILTTLVVDNGTVRTTKLPQYFKIRRNNDLPEQNQRSFAIYKFVGRGMKSIVVNGSNQFIPYDIYSIVDPKGNTFPYGHKILEYGRHDGKYNEFELQSSVGTLARLLNVQIKSYEDLVNIYNSLRLTPNFDTIAQALSAKDKNFESYLEMLKDVNRYNTQITFITANEEYTREDVEKDSSALYLFTDNTDRDSGDRIIDPESSYAKEFANGLTIHYPTQTTALIRGLENAAPISTQHWYHEGAKGKEGRWKAEDFEEFKAVIDKEIAYIEKLLSIGKYQIIVLPKGGLFGSEDGISNIQALPEFVEYITDKLSQLGIGMPVEAPELPVAAPATYQPVDTSEESEINIYAGTGENADLSNFAKRPFDFREGCEDKTSEAYHYFMDLHPFLPQKFNSVEQAFQAFKWAYALSDTDFAAEYVTGLDMDKSSESYKHGEKIFEVLNKIINSNSSAEIKRLGGTRGLLSQEDIKFWDENSSIIMKFLIKQSFKQNPQALQRLLATGNATLTHTQDKGKWGTEFPRLLMEVREELRREQSSAELNNAKDNANDPERFAGVVESEQTINSLKTILSNKELKYWNEHGVDNMPRILVASERTDPAFHVNEILDILDGKKSVNQWGVMNGRRQVVGLLSGKDFAGLYLITKHDGIPMKRLLETKIPKLIHFSITGLGGTKYEPGVMKPDDLLDRINEYIRLGLDPESVTIRIDPIIPGVTTPRMIENIIKRASEMGIKHIRFSIMDAYPNTVAALEKIGYDFEANYGTNPASGKYNFNAKPEKFDKIVEFMLKMANKYGVTLGSCAENITRRGISKEGCLSVSAVNKMLGTSIEDRGTDNNELRKLCSCYGGKIDALAYGKNCASHCIYCYAKHENDAAMLYYNEDGTLKDNQFTRTSDQSFEADLSEHLLTESEYSDLQVKYQLKSLGKELMKKCKGL